MSIMRALKNVGIGYLQGTTDIMAQKAAQKREDEKLKEARLFEEKLMKDKILETKLANIELENLKNGNKVNSDKEKTEKFIKDKREQLGAQGWNNNFLDIMELQGHLNSDAAWNTWFGRHDNYFQGNGYGLDWHVNAQIPSGDTKIGFQDVYIQHYNDTLADKDKNFNISSVLQQNNNVSSNISDALTSDIPMTSGVSEEQDKAIDLQGRAPMQTGTTQTTQVDTTQTDTAQTTQVDTTQTVGTSTKSLATNNSYLAGFEPQRLQKEIHLTSPDDPRWTYTDINPQSLKEGEIVKLTLSSDGRSYTSSIMKVGDSFNDILGREEDRDSKIVTSIYNNKGLFNAFEDLGQFLNTNKNFTTEDYFSQNSQRQKLFVNIYDYATLLDRSYIDQGTTALRPQELVGLAINLHKSTSMDTASGFTSALLALPENATDVEKGNIALAGVNQVMAQIREAVSGIDSSTEEGQRLISRIQGKAINEFKVNFAMSALEESARGPLAVNNEDYKRMIKLVDAIVADKQKGPDGNKGAYWITSAKANAAIQAEQEKTEKEYEEASGVIEARNQTDKLLDKEKWLSDNTVKTSKEMGGMANWRKEYGVKDDGLFSLVKYDHDSKTGLKKFVDASLPAGHVQPRPDRGTIPQGEWDRIWSSTHNPDGTPKQQ